MRIKYGQAVVYCMIRLCVFITHMLLNYFFLRARPTTSMGAYKFVTIKYDCFYFIIQTEK